MSIHQNMARDLLAAGVSDLQDAYRIAWMKGIPQEFRKPGTGGVKYPQQKAAAAKGIEAIARRTQARIAERSKKILPLHHEGKGANEIARITGYSPNFCRRVIRESGFIPNKITKSYPREKKDYSKLLKRAHSLRMDGLSWVDIGQAMGVSKTRIREAYNEWKAAK